ncbi:MAG TPA: methylenetetrahydrofolate reductase [Acidimicrobiales bacterium]|nr:methylenetetrahydrofolate reductase [Acidimicrobiales bacterium]
MHIAELLAAGPTYSFEFFPPKNDAEQATLVHTLRRLEPLEPSFVSVTYRGGRSSRDRTLALVGSMLQVTALNPMAHLICVAHTRLELAEILIELRKAGVDNLMALGGDPPTDPDAGPGELAHAIELVELARAIGGFSVGVAAHPLGHPRSPDIATDRRHLAEKLRRADFGVTPFFFEADDYLRLIDDMEPFGLDKPIIPGILPVRSLKSVPRMAQMGAAVPDWMVARLERAGDPEAEARVGIECATELCSKLLAEGAPGLHFYTFNTSTATMEIYRSLGLGPAAIEGVG